MNNAELNKNITVVIRSVGERTEDLCKELLCQQISEKNVFMTNESPFTAAHKKSIEIGIEENRKWTLLIDSDVLVKEGVIRNMFMKGEKMPRSVFELHSKMLDKFFGGIRFGGVKLYRTEYLPIAIDFIPSAGETARPESTMIKEMHKRKFWWILTDEVCGLHDYEQYFKDIFRKGFTHAIKFKKEADILMTFWKREAIVDNDFRVLLEGFKIGLEAKKLMLDKNEVDHEFGPMMKRIGLKEKGKVNYKMYGTSIKKYISEFQPAKEFVDLKLDSNLPYQPNLFLERLKLIFKRK